MAGRYFERACDQDGWKFDFLDCELEGKDGVFFAGFCFFSFHFRFLFSCYYDLLVCVRFLFLRRLKGGSSCMCCFFVLEEV